MENMEDADAVTQRLLGLSRQKLQAEAKKMGVKANRKSMDIIKDIVSATTTPQKSPLVGKAPQGGGAGTPSRGALGAAENLPADMRPLLKHSTSTPKTRPSSALASPVARQPESPQAGSPFRAAPTSQETTPPPLTSLATAAAYPAALGYTTPGRATLADALQAGGTAFVNSTRKPYNIQDLASRASALALASRLNNLSLDAHVINSALKGVPGSTLKAAGAGVARTAAAMPAAPFTADPAFGQQQQQQRGAVGCNTSAGFSFSVAKAAAAAAMPDITSDTLAGAFRMAAAPAVRPAAAPAMVPILSAAPSPEGTTPASTTDQASEISPAFIPDVHTDACSSQNPAAACTPVTEGGRKLCFLDAGSASANDATPAPDAQTPDAAAATPDDFGVGTMISPQDEPGPALLQTANTRLARVLATAQKTPLPRFNELTLRDAAHYQVPVEPAPTPVAKGPAQTDYSAHFVAPSPYPLMNRPGFSLQQQPAVAAGDGGGAQAAAGVEMTQSKFRAIVAPTPGKTPARRVVVAGDTAEDKAYDRLVEQDMTTRATGVTWRDVVGLTFIKQQVREACLSHTAAASRSSNNKAPAQSLLLYGPPGMGKTLLAQALASEAGGCCITLSGPELMSAKNIGQADKIVRSAFRVARTRGPGCVLLLDKLEAAVGAAALSSQPMAHKIRTELLVGMDELALLNNKTASAPASQTTGRTTRATATKAAAAPAAPSAGAGYGVGVGVVVVGVTSAPLDDALGRAFGQRLLVPLPDTESREELLLLYMAKANAALGVKAMEELVKGLEGYSCLDIISVCKTATRLAGRVAPSQQHFQAAQGHVARSSRMDEALQFLKWKSYLATL